METPATTVVPSRCSVLPSHSRREQRDDPFKRNSRVCRKVENPFPRKNVPTGSDDIENKTLPPQVHLWAFTGDTQNRADPGYHCLSWTCAPVNPSPLKPMHSSSREKKRIENLSEVSLDTISQLHHPFRSFVLEREREREREMVTIYVLLILKKYWTTIPYFMYIYKCYFAKRCFTLQDGCML